MISRVERFRAAQQDLVTLSTRDLLAVWRALDYSNARAATDVLLATFPDITAAYGDLAAVAAADLYEDLRAEYGPGSPFRARAAAVAPLEQSQAAVRWAVAPLWADDPRLDATLARLSGALRRLTLQPARDTIQTESRREGTTYAVVPAGDACEWCLMLASRGAVYHEQRERQWHDSCRCVAAPVWRPTDLPDINQRLRDEWQQVASDAPDPRAAWREHVASRT